MRILAITNLYPRLGLETRATYNRAQFRALAAQHEVRAIVPVSWTEKLTALIRLDPRLSRYRNQDGIWVDHPWYFFPPRLAPHRYGECFLASIRRVAKKAIETFRPDVLLACWAHPDGWAAVQLGREFGLPVVIKVVGSDVLVATRDPRRRLRVAEALRAADSVIAVSRHLAESVIQLGVEPAKVHVVPEGVDEHVFMPGNRSAARARLGLPVQEKIVLFVGNLLQTKGAGVLIEACSKLKNQGQEFRCYLLGQGRDQRALRSLIADQHLDDIVTLAGSCPQVGLADWYRACDVVALPSFSEGIPNVLREAMMCGRRFVATAVGGVPEITTPGVGRLVDPRDANAFAEALGEELTRPADSDPLDVRRLNISWERSAGLLAGCLRNVSDLGRSQEMDCATDPKAQNLSAAHDGIETHRIDEKVRSLRILAVTNLYPNPSNPLIATYNRQQFKALSRQHDLRVVAPIAWTSRLGHPLAVGPHWYQNADGIQVVHPTYYFPPRVLEHRWDQCYLRSVIGCIERQVRQYRPDVLLACWAHPDGWAAVQIGRKHGIPVVVKVHGSDVLVATRNVRRRARVAEALRDADGVIAVSDDLARQVVAFGVESSRIHVVQNGINTQQFGPGDRSAARSRLGIDAEQQMILFVGNLLLSKGAGLLIEACGKLKRQGRVFNCYLVGQGRDKVALRSLITREGLDGIVSLGGSCEQAGLADWYHASSVVSLPSFSEGVPNVLREAMMCGRRFVATAVGGIPEITTAGVGRLVKLGDVDGLAAALQQELAEPADADAADARRLNTSWEQSAEMLAGCLRKAMGTQSSSRRPATICSDVLVQELAAYGDACLVS